MLILIYGDKGWIGTQFISLLEKQGYNYILGNERVDNTYLLLNKYVYLKECALSIL